MSLPKGGGAIRGMGEKFAANPVTGTGSLSVPVFTSPGRSGSGPQLSLSYDSGAGNGPFGWGWNLSVPAISRKTDKGLPRYRDAEETDVFILSGAEDLVPVPDEDQPGGPRAVGDAEYRVRRYRPRTEGLFARIERWTDRATGEIHWRSISRDNVTTLYGKAEESRVADPDDGGRVFTWLICESYDDKGNAIVYEYASENGENVDLAQTNERNRARTANRYLKRIKYGNRVSRLIQADLTQGEWMFEVVFDYDEDHYEELDLDPALPEAGQHRLVRASASPGQPWPVRPDPFSSYRAGFEVRTYRRCRRVLMFHHFGELGDEPCLVRSTEFDYADLDYSQPTTIEAELAHQGSTRFASFIRSVTRSGFVRDGVGEVTYLKKSLPPLEFEYGKASIQDDVRELDAGSLENLPVGLDGGTYQWADLDGEGVSGILTEQAEAWFYKPNLGEGLFGPQETVAAWPSSASLRHQQLLDLAGDGQLDLVALAGPTPGFFERTHGGGWEPLKAFAHLPNITWDDQNLRFVDLNGDGHADVLISEHDVFAWYPSLAEEGFGQAERVHRGLDEEEGPRLVFADGTESVYLADMCGDGLADIVRLRNGGVCYWPNQGYGRFGAKVTMDDAPRFDNPDRFDQERLRLADIDGSGTNDIVYLGHDGVRLYFNQSGNRWSGPRRLDRFPPVDDLSSVMTADLLGNGTACLVWSSPLPGDSRRQMRYIDLVGGQKPHLLIKSANNLGAETHIHYAPSTKSYLEDKAAGKPWITKLPFPVHVVERVETHDRVSGNRFVTRHAYHHGHFDGTEREFRGFGMVEQFDTEEFAALGAGGEFPDATNVEEASHAPPVHTKTWFHTGAYLGRDHVSDFFAGLTDGHDRGEYYREPAWLDDDDEAGKRLLDDTVLPAGLTADEEREACRALRGSMLRQEVYALDGTGTEDYPSGHPYTVTEQNFTVRRLQPKGGDRHAVFFAHAREAINYHYERNPEDPRTSHALTLEVDDFGNVLRSATVGYGRREPDAALPTSDQEQQTRTLVTFTDNSFTNTIEQEDDYRAPLPGEARTHELTGLRPADGIARFGFDEVLDALSAAVPIPYEEPADGTRLQKRMIEHLRTQYRPDDLGASAGDPSALLPPNVLESLALPGETYKLAFTPGLVESVFGGRVTPGMLASEGGYVDAADDGGRWLPAGRVFLSLGTGDTPEQELAHAREHFFTPRRFRDPFGNEATFTPDTYDLLGVETRDPLGNTLGAVNDYRTLQPRIVTDPNNNRSEVAFDALGMVVGTAVMGKLDEGLGDTLDRFEADLTEGDVLARLSDPLADPHAILQGATTRLVYDIHAYARTRSEARPQGPVVYSLARETHQSDLKPEESTKVQHTFGYSDGFAREIQKKVRAEPGSLTEGGPDVSPRWVGSGWTVFDNKGKPVRQFEPFFTDTHRLEFDVRRGVSPILRYDPAGRVVATIHPNHTWEKVAFDAWKQETWDVNDTAQISNPADDADVGDFFARLPADDYLPTWHAQRSGGALGAHELAAATRTAVHAETSTVAHVDSLGRAFLTTAHNKLKRSDSPPEESFQSTRVVFDVEGNQREVVDALGRIVMRYDYDMLGNPVHSASMEAGERWTLGDAAGRPIRAWDGRGHAFRTEHDALRRPVRRFVSGSDAVESDPRVLGREVTFEQIEYGEDHADDDPALNLRTRVFETRDGAGIATSEAYDFKGNPLRGSRRFARDYKGVPDWAGDVALEDVSYASSTAYDALDRMVTATSPDGSVIRPAYDEANLLERVDANLRGETLDDEPVWTPFVTGINYNARGQRERIDYGNGASTTYEYDPLTFRLVRLFTWRDATAFPDDCPSGPPADWPGCAVQNLRYTYDPVGNITHIQDDAQQTIFFRNRRVEPGNDYLYDATYQLIEATGREHLGQIGGVPTAPDAFDGFHPGLLHPGDGSAMGTYLESYVYDAVGNILSTQHRGSDPAHPGWPRRYDYAEPSLIEPGKTSNRLTSTRVGGGLLERYRYDAHGSMTRMPHLPVMQWTFLDQLRASSKQVVDAGTPETTYYVYDAAGQRVRKVTERQAAVDGTPTRKSERVYFGGFEIGGFEIYREYFGGGVTITLERETLHMVDDNQRVAMVETRVRGDDGSPPQMTRFQLGNHLGSASVELDEAGWLISYEEYFPYGSTSYQAVDATIKSPAKRYRYTGMERDEETGLAYHGARHYAGWLGRWSTADPAGTMDGPNLFAYSHNNPIKLRDQKGHAGEEVTDAPALSSAYSSVSYGLLHAFMQESIRREEFYQLTGQRWSEHERLVDSFRVKPSVAGSDGPTISNDVGPRYESLEASVQATAPEAKSLLKTAVETFIVQPLADLYTDPVNSRLSYLNSTPWGWAAYLLLVSPPAYGGKIKFHHYDYTKAPREGLPHHHFSAQIVPDEGETFQPLHYHLTQEAPGKDKPFVVRAIDRPVKGRPTPLYDIPNAEQAAERIRREFLDFPGQELAPGIWDCGYIACLGGAFFGNIERWEERSAHNRGLVTMFTLFNVGRDLWPNEIKRFAPFPIPPGLKPQ